MQLCVQQLLLENKELTYFYWNLLLKNLEGEIVGIHVIFAVFIGRQIAF